MTFWRPNGLRVPSVKKTHNAMLMMTDRCNSDVDEMECFGIGSAQLEWKYLVGRSRIIFMHR